MTETASWFLDQPEPVAVDLRGQRVTAILVTRNGAPWLPDTLTALSRLTLRPSSIIAVDNGSDDESGEILQAARRTGIVDLVLQGSADASFGEAVTQAVAELRAGNQWLWLLHDDAAPDPNALTELVTLALRTPGLALAYPLLVRPTRRHHTPLTLELGATISGTGRRHLDLDPGEAAQGQYEPSATLGGSTCGLLVEQAAFTELRGFSLTIPSYRDGVELGWRANLAGHLVMTCPAARLTHHQAGRSERRSGTLAQAAHRSETAWDHLMGMRLVSAHSFGFGALLTWWKLVLSALVRALGFLLDKAPDQARDELLALGDFVRGRSRTQRLRRRIARLGPSDDLLERVARLRPPWWSAFVAFFYTITDMVRGAVGSDHDHDQGLMLDDLLGDEFESRAGDRPARVPGWVWAVGLVVVALFSGRHLMASGPVRAERLLAAPASLSDAFQVALSSPPGTSWPPAPWLLLQTIGSAPFIRPNWFVVVVLFATVPVTMLVASWYLRFHLGQRWRMSWVLALLYALIPVLLGGLGRGDLWLAVLAILLPFFVAWLDRWPTQTTGVSAWQPAAGVAVALSLVVTIEPILWLFATVAVVVTVLKAKGGALGWIRAGLACLVPLVVWGDWLWSLRQMPGRLLTGASPLLGATTTTPVWQMLLGREQAGGLPPIWISACVFGAIWLAAAVAIARLPRLALAGVGGLAGVTAGVVLSRFTITVDGARSTPDASPWLLIGFAALLAVVVAYLGEQSKLASRDFGLGQALVGLLTGLLAAAGALALVWWAWGGLAGVTRGADARIPYYVAQGEIVYGANSLIVDQSGDPTRWSIRSGGQPTWGLGEMRTGGLALAEVWQDVQQIVAQMDVGRFDDSMPDQLARLGIRYIVLIQPRPDTAGSLEASTGLGSGSANDTRSTIVYQVQSAPTAVQIGGAAGPSLSLVPSDSPICQQGRALCRVAEVGPDSLLLLSQPMDSNLVVTVGGARLEPASSPDWRAAFSLAGARLCDDPTAAEPTPPGCGFVEVKRTAQHVTWRYVQLALGFFMILFALPSATARASDRSPRRAQGVMADEGEIS